MSDTWNSNANPVALDAANGVTDTDHHQNGNTAENGASGDSKWVTPQAHDYTALQSETALGGFGSSARVYDWDDEYGDVGPKYPDLEIELFGEPTTRHERTGLDFSR